MKEMVAAVKEERADSENLRVANCQWSGQVPWPLTVCAYARSCGNRTVREFLLWCAIQSRCLQVSEEYRVSGAVVCGLIRQVWHHQNAVKNVNVSLFILKILCLGLTNCTNNIDFDSCKLQPYRPKHVRKGF